jgi:hypothetical protein
MKLHMAARSRFSTSTVIDSEYVVPWLSAEGPLAYSPTKPPARDYFFQYTWILPGIFNPQVNLRERRYFGSPLKDSARFLFDFWANARRGDGSALQRYCQFGSFSDNELRTPMAAYHHVRDYRDTPGSLLIQHGSYQGLPGGSAERPDRRGLALSGHRTGHSFPLLAIPARRTLAR